MATLTVRKLDRRVYERLRVRAAKHGVSMEEEAQRILKQAVIAPENLSSVFRKYFGPENGIDMDLLNQRQPDHPMDLDNDTASHQYHH